jgi:hypothetical protein
MAQVQRIPEINELHTVTEEVVEAARESLVLGVLRAGRAHHLTEEPSTEAKLEPTVDCDF